MTMKIVVPVFLVKRYTNRGISDLTNFSVKRIAGLIYGFL